MNAAVTHDSNEDNDKPGFFMAISVGEEISLTITAMGLRVE